MTAFERRRQAAIRHARALPKVDERDVGISKRAADVLGALLDEPVEAKTRHYLTARSPKAACGLLGLRPHTMETTDVTSSITCGACKAAVERRQRRADRAALKRIENGPITLREIDRETRWRLEGARLAEVRGAGLFITDAGRARLTERA